MDRHSPPRRHPASHDQLPFSATWPRQTARSSRRLPRSLHGRLQPPLRPGPETCGRAQWPSASAASAPSGAAPGKVSRTIWSIWHLISMTHPHHGLFHGIGRVFRHGQAELRGHQAGPQRAPGPSFSVARAIAIDKGLLHQRPGRADTGLATMLRERPMCRLNNRVGQRHTPWLGARARSRCAADRPTVALDHPPAHPSEPRIDPDHPHLPSSGPSCRHPADRPFSLCRRQLARNANIEPAKAQSNDRRHVAF